MINTADRDRADRRIAGERRRVAALGLRPRPKRDLPVALKIPDITASAEIVGRTA